MISNNHNDNNINNILALHFSGERLTEEQEKILIDWGCQNKEEYIRLSEVFQTATESDNMKFNAERAWAKFDARLARHKQLKLYRVRQYFAYAACITLIFGISYFLMKPQREIGELYSNTTASLHTVTLPDSSTVTLYPHSQITYFADAAHHERITELKGKAFFEVRPDTEQPFIIHNNNTSIRVLGTSFLVDSEGHFGTDIFVHEGVVQVSTMKDRVILKSNEQAQSDGGSIIKSKIKNSDIIFEKHIKQKNYQNTPLSQIVLDIENEFSIQISLTESMKSQKISTQFKFENVEDILYEISYICNLKYRKISDKKYELY